MFDSLGAKTQTNESGVGLYSDGISEGRTLRGEPFKVPVQLGIDQSYTGFAVTAINGMLFHTWCFQSKLKEIERLVDIQGFLVGVFKTLADHNYVVTETALEGYAFGSQMAHMLGELGGMVKLTLFEYEDIKPLIVTPTQLKKYATGRGNKVSKAEILLAVYKHWGVEYRDDNMADSYVLARIASGHSTLAYQAEVVKKVQDGRY